MLLLELSVNFLSWPTRLFMILFPHTSPVHRCVFLLTCALFILTSHSGLGVSAPALPSAWNTFHCLVFWLTPATPQVSLGIQTCAQMLLPLQRLWWPLGSLPYSPKPESNASCLLSKHPVLSPIQHRSFWGETDIGWLFHRLSSVKAAKITLFPVIALVPCTMPRRSFINIYWLQKFIRKRKLGIGVWSEKPWVSVPPLLLLVIRPLPRTSYTTMVTAWSLRFIIFCRVQHDKSFGKWEGRRRAKRRQ